MKDSARRVKFVEWSAEVFEQLCTAVDEAIEIYKQDGQPLPPPASGRDFASPMLNVA